MDVRVEHFLKSPSFAVVGASIDRAKFGNKVLRCYMQNTLTVVPVNPKMDTVEGLASVGGVSMLPPEVKSISIITPPAVTETVVAAAIAHGITDIWMQPGAESRAAVELCQANGINFIADGSCFLVVMGCH